MGYNYIFVLLTPLAVLGFIETFLFWPNLLYFSLSASCLAIFLAVRKITKRKITSLEYWNFCLLPIIFFLTLSGYLIILPEKIFAHALAIVYSFFIFYYLKNIRGGEKNEILENLSSSVNLLNIFFLFSCLHGFKAFLGIPAWPLMLSMLVIFILLIYETFWSNNIPYSEGAIYIFLIPLILIQLAWSLNFLSLSHNTLGLILAICYYVIIGLAKPALRQGLIKKSVKFYLIVGFLSIFLLLLTAKWI